MKAKVVISLLIAFGLPYCGYSQVNHLEKLVNLNEQSISIKAAFAEIESQGDFFFSYDSDLVPQDSVVKVQFSNVKVRVVLSTILPQKLKYKSLGNHIVIFIPAAEKKKEVVISGYITDGRSRKPLANATIYEPGQNLIASTDATGYYEMTVSAEAGKIGITASKNGYRQEVIYLNPEDKDELDFKLLTEEEKLDNIATKPIEYPNVDERALVKLIVPQRVMDNADNITIFEKAGTQISFLPGLGTSGLLNGSSINNLSINILGGYSEATNGLEIGGLLNINRSDMTGVQIAGIGNITGRFVKGFQTAGVLNYNGLDFDGAQIAGFSNINGGTFNGWQVAGFSNVLNGELHGVQLSGFSNLAVKDAEGAQISGFSNIAVKDINSLQLSGFTNYAHVNSGIQMASFFNYAHHNKGAQFAFVNYADTSSGIPVGFISIVKHGYHVFEVSATETFPINMSFRTGVNLFYNIFELGVGSGAVKAAYGVGTMPWLGKKKRLGLSMDLTAGAVGYYSSTPDWEYIPYVARFDMMLNIQTSKKFAIGIGPSVSYYVQPLGPESTVDKLSFYQFYERTTDNWYEQAWLGGRLSLRFF